jgi:hypothetical protein
MTDWIDLNALTKILIGGLLCGAGLPALFALGLRALHLGARQPVSTGGEPVADRSADRIVGDNPVGIGLAVVCFAVVLAAIGWGIYWIVST